MKVCLATVAAVIVLILSASSPITAGTLPNISGVWYANGSPAARCSISQSGSSVTLRNQQGRAASGSFSDPSTLETDWGFSGGGHITGTISSDLRRITWSNGSFWIRESGNFTAQSAGSTSSVTTATTTSVTTSPATPEPERLRIQAYVVRDYNAVPIHLFKVYLANASASHGRRYEQCVWFRNVSTKVATSWEHGMPFLRGYEDHGARLPEPTEQRPPTPQPTPEP